MPAVRSVSSDVSRQPPDRQNCSTAPESDLAAASALGFREGPAICFLAPVCDFLLWVLYRHDRFDLCPPPPPGKPITERYGHFPQFAAACGAPRPQAALALLPAYAREELAQYDVPPIELWERIERALPIYDLFLEHWQCKVKPIVQDLLDSWRDQLSTG